MIFKGLVDEHGSASRWLYSPGWVVSLLLTADNSIGLDAAASQTHI